MQNIPFQYELRPEIPNVFGALEYREFRETLIKIDEILNKSGLEHQIISQVLEQYVKITKRIWLNFTAVKMQFFITKNSDTRCAVILRGILLENLIDYSVSGLLTKEN